MKCSHASCPEAATRTVVIVGVVTGEPFVARPIGVVCEAHFAAVDGVLFHETFSMVITCWLRRMQGAKMLVRGIPLEAPELAF